MNLLLDTHVAIWAVALPGKLPISIARLIADESNVLHVSVASIWEIAVKYALGRASAPPFSGREALEIFEGFGLTVLDIGARHVILMDELPRLHADPFDRIMLAQALAEPMHLVTHDSQLAAYSDTIIAF